MRVQNFCTRNGNHLTLILLITAGNAYKKRMLSQTMICVFRKDVGRDHILIVFRSTEINCLVVGLYYDLLRHSS